MRTYFKQREAVVEMETGRLITLEYFLIQESEDSGEEPVYGIQIVKTENAEQEMEFTGGISHSKEFVSELVDKLSEHTVTPLCLLEIIDEWITIREAV